MNLCKTNSVVQRRRALAGALAGLALACAAMVQSCLASTWTTNTLLPGTRFETGWYVQDSGKPGPTIMIVGGVHGNEPAGAAAAEVIRFWPLTAGRMVVVPRANVPGLLANKRMIPNLDTNIGNLNRNYPRAGKEEPPRGELATAIWALALEYKPAWLLDLHEGFDFHQLNEKSVGSSVIVAPDAKGEAEAKLMLEAVNVTITNPDLKFVQRGPPVDGSLARAGGEHLRIPSMTLETTTKQPMPKRVRQHEIMVHHLLADIGMMEKALPAETYIAGGDGGVDKSAHAGAANPVRVALYKGPGTGGAGPPAMMLRLNHLPESTIQQLSPEDIQNGALTNYDVIIFGGGSGSREAESIGETGREEVRKFVAKGGGYIGICAGAYLATCNYPWSLKLINAKTISPKWQRGKGTVTMELTGSGKELLGDRSGKIDVHYANGPVVTTGEHPDLPPFEVLAYFRSEMAEHDSPPGVMVNSPAIFKAAYHQGRVVCISPHPEQTQGLEDIVPAAVSWVSGKSKTLTEKTVPKAE